MSFEVKQKTIADKILNLVTKHPSAVSDYRKLIQYLNYKRNKGLDIVG